MELSLKAARVNAGYSQTEAAKLLCISPDTLSLYERGVRFPKVPTIHKMLDVYGVAFDDLIFLPRVTV